MSLAERIEPTLAARRERAAGQQAARAERDTFIVDGFARLQAAFDTSLRQALGSHSALRLEATARSLAVQGRGFTNLAIGVWTVEALFNGTSQRATFTPALDFRATDQFGRIDTAIDFAYAPLRHGDRVARALLDGGLQLRGRDRAALVLALPDGPIEPGAADLEAAFAAWWLR